MAKEKEKKSKKCSTSRKILWYAFGAAGLGARGLAALALLAIAIKMYPLKYQAKFFNACVEEVQGTFGAYDIIAKISSESVEKIRETITWKIRKIEKIRSTLTLTKVEGQGE